MANSNYIPAAATIAALSSISSGFAQTSSFEAQLKADTEAAIQNAGNLVTSYELQQTKNKEQIENINSVLGDKLSERGLKAMKEASLLKTAAAETGTTGGSTNEAIREAFINENMDKANIISQAKQQTRNILIGMETTDLSVRNQIDSILLGGAIQIETDPLLAGISGGLSVFTDMLNMLPQSERTKIFGVSPTTPSPTVSPVDYSINTFGPYDEFNYGF